MRESPQLQSQPECQSTLTHPRGLVTNLASLPDPPDPPDPPDLELPRGALDQAIRRRRPAVSRTVSGQDVARLSARAGGGARQQAGVALQGCNGFVRAARDGERRVR